MSVLSRVSAPAATHDLAGLVVALFSNPERAAPRDLPGSVEDQLPRVLVDPIAGYEIPAFEFADRRIRRVCCWVGSASVILNDLYSKGKEADEDFDLRKVIAAEERCSQQEAIERTVEIHNQLMHTFVEEVAVLSQLGSVALRRFLAGTWAWLGGNREWHSTTERYHGSSKT